MQPAHAARDRVEVVDDRTAGQRVAQRARDPRRQLAVAPAEQHAFLGPPPRVPLGRRLPVHPEGVGAVAVHRHHDVDVVEEGGQPRRGGRRVPPRRDVPAQMWWLHHGVERRTREADRRSVHVGGGVEHEAARQVVHGVGTRNRGFFGCHERDPTY